MEEQVEYNAGKKKERILIGKDIESPCEKCKELSVCNSDCEKYEKFAEEFNPPALKVYSRTEAIERIAKALAFVQAKTFVDENQWEIVMRGCRYEAEAALNALLEE